MDPVGFEPTISAPQPYCFLRSGLYTYHLSTTASCVCRENFLFKPALCPFLPRVCLNLTKPLIAVIGEYRLFLPKLFKMILTMS